MFSKTDETAPGHYGPGQTALLLLDYHTLFMQMLAADKGNTTVQVAADMRNWARSSGIQVIHCLIDTEAKPASTCKNADMLSHVVENLRSPEGAEPAQLTEGEGDIAFTRKAGHVSALKSPGLVEYLNNKGIKSLLIMGWSTSACVLSTARAATDEDFVVTVIEDACADREDRVHEFVTQSVLSNRAYIAKSAEFQRGYAERA